MVRDNKSLFQRCLLQKRNIISLWKVCTLCTTIGMMREKSEGAKRTWFSIFVTLATQIQLGWSPLQFFFSSRLFASLKVINADFSFQYLANLFNNLPMFCLSVWPGNPPKQLGPSWWNLYGYSLSPQNNANAHLHARTCTHAQCRKTLCTWQFCTKNGASHISV